MKRERFREILAADGAVVAPLVHDAMSAQVAERVGFELLGISGYGVSLSSLGLPDTGFISIDDMMDASRGIATTTDVPVFADVDTGYGNAISARRAIKECIVNTDLAGLFVEDQVAPKRCGHMSGKRVVPVEEGVGKIRAMVDVRDDLDPDFVIIARTDARGAVGGSLEEAIDRGTRYQEAGADVIFVEAPANVEEVERIGEEVPGHLMYTGSGVGGVSPRLDRERVGELGFDVYSIAATIKPALVGVHDVLSGIAEGGLAAYDEFERDHADHPLGDLHAFSGMDEIRELEECYLPEEELGKYADTVGRTLGGE